MKMKHYNIVLTIAGSDSGGGAGVQADIKTISACGCYAASAITAVTVQNTLGVNAVRAVPVDILDGQIDAVQDLLFRHVDMQVLNFQKCFVFHHLTFLLLPFFTLQLHNILANLL